MGKGQTGVSLGGDREVSPAFRERYRRARRAEERRWRKRNGPVTVRRVDPATLRPRQ